MKTAKRVFSAFLAMLICLSALALSASAKRAGDVAEGQIFNYGMYPQTLITDPDVLQMLEGKKPDANGDVTIGTAKFRAYHYEVPDAYKGAPDEYADYLAGVLQEYKNFSNYYGFIHSGVTYWFEYAPIEWRVLKNEGDTVLLMAEKVLDTGAYTNKPAFKPVGEQNTDTWENSDIRAWLNGTFMNIAFDAKEQSYIQTSTLKNSDNPIHGTYNGVPSAFAGDVYNGYPYQGTYGGNDTQDKVFLPSFEEITDKAYGFNTTWTALDDFGRFAGYYDRDTARRATATDFAKAHGVWANIPEKDANGNLIPDDEFPSDPCYFNCRYWLRTPGYENGFAAGVLEDGRVSTGWYANHFILGLRPMIRVSADALSAPLRIAANDGSVRYRQEDVRIYANQGNVLWTSSDPTIAEIDEDGYITIHNVGTVTITATLADDPTNTASCDLEIHYTWWQHLIRIFLFGWIWY